MTKLKIQNVVHVVIWMEEERTPDLCERKLKKRKKNDNTDRRAVETENDICVTEKEEKEK